MLNTDNINVNSLAKTYAAFLPKERINQTSLPIIQEDKKEKFERKYGMLYTTASVIAAAGILTALYKGGSLYKFTTVAKEHLNRYSAKTLDALRKFQEYPFLRTLRLKTGLACSYIGEKMLEAGNFIANLNPFKDIAFDRFTKKIKIKPLFDKITQIFTRSAKKLSFSKYVKANKDFCKFQDVLKEATEEIKIKDKITFGNGQTISGKDLANRLENTLQTINTELANISKTGASKRFDNTVKMLNENSEREFLGTFKEYKGNSWLQKLSTKVKECGDFIPAKVMESRKQELFAPLFNSKKKISNSILDLYQSLSKSIDEIFYNSTLNNEELGHSYVVLRDLLAKFKQPSAFTIKRSIVRENIIQELNNAINKFKNIPNSSANVKKLESLITQIKSDSKGLVEEAVSSCKILKETNPELYEKLIAARDKFQDSLNHAVLFETDKTYRKLLDFSLHSLPTDFLTMGVGLGGVGYIWANKKKSRQEKIALNLQTGIPAIGGILVSFLSNMRQVASGTGAIFLGVISAMILNRLGSITNHYYTKTYLKNNDNKTNNDNRPKDLEKLKS